jgi:hypothetical protein
VFVSVGRTATLEQERFVAAIESHMLRHELLPQTLGRNYWSSQQPLKAVDELMGQCSGAAIVGFERLRVVHGIDRRGSDKEQRVTDVSLPTVWNQIEAAMAYARRLPLLVFVQTGLRTEGLLEMGYDWYIQQMSLDETLLADPAFGQIFDDWRSRVEKFHAERLPATPGKNETGRLPSQEARGDLPPALDRRALLQILGAQLSEDDLRSLCFFLHVDYERLKGATKKATAISLITFFEQMNHFDDLVAGVRELRPTGSDEQSFPAPVGQGTSEPNPNAALYHALLTAFPTPSELDQMLDHYMKIKLAEIASGNLSEQVFAVIRYAEARGWVARLLKAALAANPDNPDLRALAESGVIAG